MSPPRRPQGPRSPGSSPGISAGNPGGAHGGAGQGPRFGPSARSGPGQPPRPRSFDGKRGWTGSEAAEGRGGAPRGGSARPGGTSGAEGPSGAPGRQSARPGSKPGEKPWANGPDKPWASGPDKPWAKTPGKSWAKPPGKAWARPPAEGRQDQNQAEAAPQRGPRPGSSAGQPMGPRHAEADAMPRGRPDGPRRDFPQRDHAEDRAPVNTFWMHGLHAVGAALLNPRRRLRRLLLTADAEETLTARLPPGTYAARKLSVERVEDRTRFHSFLPEDSVHQGAAMLVEPLPGQALEDLLEGTSGPVLLLDQVTDPRNVGAILRSAAAFGAAAVVVQDRHAPPETGALARAASGALEKVPMVREVNLARAIRSLQDKGFWVLGLAGEAKRTLAEAKPTDRRVALVLGAEAGGLRRLQRDTVDEMVRLPIGEAMESLNVAAATAVALYELGRA